MRFQLVALCLVAFCLAAAQHPQIIDFTYNQLLIETNYTQTDHHKIEISPDTLHLQTYKFPQVCELKDKLSESTDSSGTVDNFINSDDYLQSVRGKILNLLKLAQQLKNSRNYLAEIRKHLNYEEDSSSITKYKSQLQSLARKESSLSTTQRRISDMTALLDKRISQYNSNPKNQQFKAASLHFQIQNCQSKITYLNELKEKSISNASKQANTNFTKFFNELGLDFLNESQQIEYIDKFFQNMSHIKYLKEMADSLRDNIEVDRLNIQYKKSCEREKKDLKSKGSSHDEIKETLEHLRQKKKEFGNNTNKYCQGVALKLEMQIKRLLKAINWTFSCADGLAELQFKLKGQIQSLKLVQAQISKYKEDGFQEYQNEFAQTTELIQKKFQKLKTFSINQYTHEPAELEKIITETARLKAQAEQKLRKLPKEAIGNQTFGQIKDLAQKIKKEKASFCKQFNTYQKQRSKLWLEIYQFQNILKYASHMRSQYIKEAQKLQELQRYYKQMSEQIIQQIETNYSVQ